MMRTLLIIGLIIGLLVLPGCTLEQSLRIGIELSKGEVTSIYGYSATGQYGDISIMYVVGREPGFFEDRACFFYIEGTKGSLLQWYEPEQDKEIYVLDSVANPEFRDIIESELEYLQEIHAKQLNEPIHGELDMIRKYVGF